MRTELGLVVVALAALSPSRADASCVPGFDYAIFSKSGIEIQGNAGTDSWNSAAGSYAATQTCGTDADLGTNSTSNGIVNIHSNSTMVCGDVYSGAGSNPTSVVSGNGNITGNKYAQTTNLVISDVTLPTLPNASPFSPSFNNTNAILAPNKTYGTVNCKNGSLTLSAGKYRVQKLTLTSNCQLKLASGPVEFYFTGELAMQAGIVVNQTGAPGNLVFYGSSTATAVQVQGGVDANYAVYAPNAECQLQGNVDLYGALVCKDVQVQGNAHIHYDIALKNLAGGGFACSSVEISRATPIVTTISNATAIVQGTFESPSGTARTISTTADVAGFTFPYIKGHMRARTAASVSTSATTFSSGTVLFDAGATGKIPTVNNAGCGSFTGTCRNVFTVTQSPDSTGRSFRPTHVQLNDTNASTIGALIAPSSVVSGITATHWQTIVRTVLAGKLGGVDRSTAAVIGPTPVAGTSTRPTIAYFGATDGMLHAVCASTGGITETGTNVCPSLGTELWAFMPRVQLPLVRRNTTRLDGSVRVVDAFGDFTTGTSTGTRSFRTILTFQTGFADTSVGAPAAVYALDVTDPANPIVVWEYTKPSSGTAELGVGLTLAVGPTIVGTKATNLVVAQTNNGGSGGTGVVATALDLETGSQAWKFSYLYPSPPRGDNAALPLPTNGIPGGAVGVDLASQGYTTDIAMGDLYGNLWRLNAATGASQTGTGVPLFQFSSNKHPIGMVPAIYSDGGSLYAAFASGGYTDPTAASWSAGTQSLIALKLAETGPYPIAETSVTKLAFKEDLAAGTNAFAQVQVIGEQLFLTSDTSDINASTYGTGSSDTGRVITYNLATTGSSTVIVRGGAGSLANAGTTLYSSSGNRQQALATGATSTTGESVDTQTVGRVKRLLWLRTE